MSRFSSRGDHFEGEVTAASFVRAGLAETTRMCLVLDADRLQEAPGTLWTSDGLFVNTRLRPIPQLAHDPLSTLTFGEGRVKTALLLASPVPPGSLDGGADPDGAPPPPLTDGGETPEAGAPPPPPAADVMVVLSLLQSGSVEVRLLRGAPPGPGQVFGVFSLARKVGPCSF